MPEPPPKNLHTDKNLKVELFITGGSVPEVSQRSKYRTHRWVFLGAILTSVAVVYLFVIILYVLVKRNKKNKPTAEDEEYHPTLPGWYANSKGGTYRGHYEIELFIPGGSVPEGQVYKISPSISNYIFCCRAVSGLENHRVICPVVQFECLEDFSNPVTIRLPHAVANQQLLREVRVLFQEPGTTKWFTINSDYTTRNSLALVGDQNANKEEQGLNNLFMSYEITEKTLHIHTKHLGTFMCSMPAPSLEDTSLSAMLFARFVEDPCDDVVQLVMLKAVIIDNMYNLPCFKQSLYEKYGCYPVKENILITLPSDRQTGIHDVLQVDFSTKEEEDWKGFGSQSSHEKTDTIELYKRLQDELGILVGKIHLQNKGTKVGSVLVRVSFSVGQEDSENSLSYHRPRVTENFRLLLISSEEDQLQGDSDNASSTEESSTGESRDTTDSGRTSDH